MCLYYDASATERLKKRFDRNGGKLSLWKIYDKPENADHLVSKWVCEQIYSPGIKKSDRPNKDFIKNPNENILKGLHLYVNRDAARDTIANNDVIVRVEVLKKDLIAAGKYSDAAFMKINIPKSEWNRIFKSKKKISPKK